MVQSWIIFDHKRSIFVSINCLLVTSLCQKNRFFFLFFLNRFFSDENEPEEAIDENQPGPSKKSKKPKKLLPVVDEEKIKELQAEMGVTIRRFRRVLELEDEVSTESATKRFQFFADSVVERLGSRRELVISRVSCKKLILKSILSAKLVLKSIFKPSN